jgi:four helix bundle protein
MGTRRRFPRISWNWERSVPKAITSDTIWKLHVYRAALYLLDLARHDVRLAAKRGLDREIAAQLLRSAASNSANIAERYSRSTRGDRLRFFGYSLGSVRECLVWYRAASDWLPLNTCDHRLNIIAQTRPLLLGLIRSTRTRSHARHEFEP